MTHLLTTNNIQIDDDMFEIEVNADETIVREEDAEGNRRIVLMLPTREMDRLCLTIREAIAEFIANQAKLREGK